MLVDAHCHLFDRQFDADREEVLRRARAAGVGHIVIIGESRAAAEAALGLCEQAGGTGLWPVNEGQEQSSQMTGQRPVPQGPQGPQPGLQLSVVTGLHPHDAKEWGPEYEAWLRGVFAGSFAAAQDMPPVRPSARALGEIGLDYHYDHSPREVQRRVFDTQLALAQELKLPAVIHSREADDDLLAALRNFPRVRAVLHSFSSGIALLEGALALGHWASFSGMATFRNWTLDDGIRMVPAGRLMVETDAPYLAPIPYRGKRNEPSYVVKVAERVAVVRGTSFEQVCVETTAACTEFFGDRIGARP